MIDNNEEVVQAIKNNVPSYQVEKVIRLFESDATDNDYYNLAKKFLGENVDSGSWISTGTSPFNTEKKSFFECLKKEIYILFCSSDEKYSKYRQQIDATVNRAIGVAVGAIATALNISTGLIAGAVTCLVLCIYKVSKNAWCQFHSSEISTEK